MKVNKQDVKVGEDLTLNLTWFDTNQCFANVIKVNEQFIHFKDIDGKEFYILKDLLDRADRNGAVVWNTYD